MAYRRSQVLSLLTRRTQLRSFVELIDYKFPSLTDAMYRHQPFTYIYRAIANSRSRPSGRRHYAIIQAGDFSHAQPYRQSPRGSYARVAHPEYAPFFRVPPS